MKPELEKALNAVEMTYKDIVEIADGHGTPTDTGTETAGHDPITNIVNDEDEGVGLT